MKIKRGLLKYAGSFVALWMVCGLILGGNVQAGWDEGKANAEMFGLSDSSIGEILETVLNWLLSLVGILGVIGFVIAGITYLTAYGDDKAITKAKSMMTYSIMGVVVALIGLIAVNAVAEIFDVAN